MSDPGTEKDGAAPGPLARACLGVALAIYPRRFRHRFGESMRETFAAGHEAAARRGRIALFVWLVAVLVELLWSGLRERTAAWRGKPAMSAQGARRSRMLDGTTRDFRFALRGLRRSPVFAVVAVLTLALGIGATTTIFSVLEGVLLRPWPFPDASRLVVPVSVRPATGEQFSSVNYGDYEDWKAAGVFENVAVYQRLGADMAAPGGEPERVRGMGTTADFFATLDVSAALGRLPLPDEYIADAPRVAVVSDGLWRARFAADPALVGRTIRLNGFETTVVGVLSPAADVLDAGVFVPIQPTPDMLEVFRDRDNFAFGGVARLARDRDIGATRTALGTVAARIARDHAALREGTSTDIVPLARWVVGSELSRILWVALGAVGLVLLIGCANLANLLLARGMQRERELAVRAALGAGRHRLIAQLLMESLVLALLGGAAGVLFAKAATGLLLTRAPADLPRIEGVGLNPAVLAFALGLAIVSAAVFGLLPAFRSTAGAGGRALADRGAADGGLRGRRWRSTLVVAEVALTVVLLVGAGLMLRSLDALVRVDPGFDTGNVLAFNLSLPSSRYADRASVLAAHETLRERLAAVPGVTAVGQASQLPLGAGPGYLTRAYLQEGGAEPPAGVEVLGPWEIVTPGYFAVMRHSIRRGRDFTSADTDESMPVMIVNREFARQMFGDETSALGKRVRSWRDENVYREIVGVVDDVRYFGAGDEIRPVAYVPLHQDNRRGMAIVVRTESDPVPLVPAIRAAVGTFDPDLATAGFTTMSAAFDDSVSGRRFAASLLATFALLALLLAAVGLYGVLTIAVAQRTREFGVRMALGAAAGDVRRMVLRQAAVLVGIGAGAGVLLALLVTQVLTAVLFDVSATDPLTFAGVVAVLLAIALVASWIPALRATRVDPIQAIRLE